MSRALAAALAAVVLSSFAASADEDVQAIIKAKKTAGSAAAVKAPAAQTKAAPAATKAAPAATKAAPAAAEPKAAPAAPLK
jgi:hypothetical protein